MQDSLFDEPGDTPPAVPRSRGKIGGDKVRACAPYDAHLKLAAALPPSLRLGTSSWSFPGWKGLVWDDDYSEAILAKHGLAAYARHPLLRTVSLDRAFYRPLTIDQYIGYASKVPEDFRFVVKAPGLITDALVRSEDGRGMQHNARFLDPELAVSAFVQPAMAGLGRRLGALVFQLSPMPALMLARPAAVLQKLHTLLQALPDIRSLFPEAVIAVELRDPGSVLSCR